LLVITGSASIYAVVVYWLFYIHQRR